MTTTADAPETETVEQLVQTIADFNTISEKQSQRIAILEQRLVHLREERVIEANPGGDKQ